MCRFQAFLLSGIAIGPILAQTDWQQLSSCPGQGRFWADATGNSTTAIAGTGRPGFSASAVADMYAYDAATDTWSTIPDFPGGAREGADAFTIGERLFMGFGTSFIQWTNDLYEYLPATQTWVAMPSVPGLGFAYSHGFVVGDTYYLGPENSTNIVYAFSATTNTWTTVAPFPGNDRRAQCAFGTADRGYLGMGAGVISGVYADWWAYDPATDSWSGLTDLYPQSDQSCATAVGGVGYVFDVGSDLNDLYSYNAALDQWAYQGAMPTDRIANASLFTIGDHGYLVFGEKTISGGNVPSNDLWRFDPSSEGIADGTGTGPALLARQQDGGLLITTREPLNIPAVIDVLDATGRVLRSHGLAAGATLQLRLAPESGAGLRLVRLRSAQGNHVLRVVLQD